MKTAVFVIIMSYVLRLIPYRTTIQLTLLLNPLICRSYKKEYLQFYKNHQAIHPELSEAKLHSLARKSITSMSLNYAISMKYMRFKNFHSSIYKLMNDHIEHIKSLSNNTPVIFITAHLGISSIGVYLLPKLLKRQGIATLRPHTNPALGKLIVKHFKNEYSSIVPLGKIIDRIDTLLSKNGMLLLAMDSVIETKYKTKVTLLGRDFEMTNSVVWLAKKYNAKVIPIITTFNEQYLPIIEVLNPIEMSDDDTADLQKIADVISKMIRKYEHNWNLPDNYFNT